MNSDVSIRAMHADRRGDEFMNNANPEVLLLAHGSNNPDYGAACASFLNDWEHYSGTHARLCFLEQCEPLLEGLLDECLADAHSVVVLPLLLNLGMHLRQGIPDRLATYLRHHPEMNIHLADGLADVGVLASALHDRSVEILADIHAGRQSIILLTHGSRHKGVRRHITQLLDMLAARVGAEIQLAFSGYGSPRLDDVLARQAGGDCVVIVPNFLFPGDWMKQVRADMDTFSCTHSASKWVLAKPLGAHPRILELLRQQADSAKG